MEGVSRFLKRASTLIMEGAKPYNITGLITEMCEKLSAIEKSTLKEIFQLTASVYEIAEKTFLSEKRA